MRSAWRLFQALDDDRAAGIFPQALTPFIRQGNDGCLIRPFPLARHFFHDVARADEAAFEDAGKNAFPRHDTIADGFVDGAMVMTFLANLSDFQEDVATAQ